MDGLQKTPNSQKLYAFTPNRIVTTQIFKKMVFQKKITKSLFFGRPGIAKTGAIKNVKKIPGIII